MSDFIYGYGSMNVKRKKKPKRRMTVSLNEIRRSSKGKLDDSLDKEFNNQTVREKVRFTNMVGQWRKNR